MVSPALGQDELYPGIIGSDDRIAVEREGPPWNAIGQVNISGYRLRAICTGTLIAPRLVLTAAHCLVDPTRSATFAPDDIRFSAGVFRDHASGVSSAACIRFPPGYAYKAPERLLPDLPSQPVPFDFFEQDLALIVLKDAIPGVVPIAPLPVETLAPGHPVIHAAYPADRRYLLQIQKGCSTLWTKNSVTATDCDSHVGASGGPLLVESENKLHVVGVMAGSIPHRATLFVNMSAWQDLPLTAGCP